MALNPKQKLFVAEYLVDLVATQAAIRAGYSEKTARSQGQRLLTNVDIAAEIAKGMTKRSEKTEINSAWVLHRAALLANFNLRKFIKTQSDGTAVYDFSEATDDDWYCISEYTTATTMKGRGDDIYEVDQIKVKTVDKLAALKLVGQHVDIQAFAERSVVEVVDRSSVLANARKRAQVEVIVSE